MQIDVKQQGAVQFKNLIKYYWVPRTDNSLDQINPISIQDDEKEQIKSHIINLMLDAPQKVRLQLSEALTIISKHDFPRKWQGLLPQILEKLQSEDPSLLNGVLSTADSIYHRYRGQFMTDELSIELEYSQQLVRPLLGVAQRVVAAAAHGASTAGFDQNTLKVHVDNCRLVFSIFYSMNSPGLTEEFENTLKDWMACIQTVLTMIAPGIASQDPEQEGPLDAAKATACECLSLFMERNEEEFAEFLEASVRNVWQQLVTVSATIGQDNLVISAIAFLTTVVRSVHFGLFGDQSVLKQICEGIVVPNIMPRDDDVELFEMNWVEYVRRDTEGSDSDTRRRAASELVRALVEKFPSQVTELFIQYTSALLSEASSSPTAAWKSKDAAVHLASVLAVKAQTAAAGATTTNQLVDVQDFYLKHIASELAATDVDARPVIKADCLKYATTFRSQLQRDTVLDLFPKAIVLLASKHNVVHSYAAILIDRLLSMKRTDAAGSQLAFSPAELSPLLQPLLERLFAALRLPESQENEYVMKAVMRLTVFVGPSIAPVAVPALQQLSEALLAVARNPAQPGFNHYLFESLAALVRFGCQADANSSIASYEEVLFPPFQIILQEDVQEFHPYVFQVLAQLIELRTSAERPSSAVNSTATAVVPVSLPESYLQLIAPLMAPVFWERAGNVPALSRVLRAYILAVPDVVARAHLQGVLGVFQKLVASKAHDHEGLALLDAVILAVDPSAMAPYMSSVWTLLFQRLQMAKTTKFTHCFVATCALYAFLRGGAALEDSTNAVQQGIAAMVATGIWAPALRSWDIKAKNANAVAVGTVRFVCEAPGMMEGTGDTASSALFAAAVRLCAGINTANGQHAGQEEDEADGAGEESVGYAAAYAKLHNAAKTEPELFPAIPNAKSEMMQRLSAASRDRPGRMARLMQLASAEDQQAVQQLCQETGVVLS